MTRSAAHDFVVPYRCTAAWVHSTINDVVFLALVRTCLKHTGLPRQISKNHFGARSGCLSNRVPRRHGSATNLIEIPTRQIFYIRRQIIAGGAATNEDVVVVLSLRVVV